jgi:ABC-type dipeptide/oligopeptide/nickel transport system ATPase component
MADRVAVLAAGQVVEEGPAAEVLGAPRHAHTRALVAARAVLERPAAPAGAR